MAAIRPSKRAAIVLVLAIVSAGFVFTTSAASSRSRTEVIHCPPNAVPPVYVSGYAKGYQTVTCDATVSSIILTTCIQRWNGSSWINATCYQQTYYNVKSVRGPDVYAPCIGGQHLYRTYAYDTWTGGGPGSDLSASSSLNC